MDDFKRFISSSAAETLNDYRAKNDNYWKTAGENLALSLFKETAERVPAYKKFLREHKVNHLSVKTIDDFKKVPLTDKSTYINKYRLNELCWDGKIGNSYLLSASSGSTGIPNFWPRSTEQTKQGASISELIYKEFFEADKKSTLYIVAFAMGMWIAGTYMMSSTEWVAQKGYPITVATPGLNREEIIRLVKMGGQYYDQVILVGYPPFVKDVVDFGIEQGLNWKKINIKFMFSGEAFTERWRAHIAHKTGLKNPLTDTINVYGSADVGLVAHETPFTNFLRHISAKNPDIMKELFAAERVPSVNQYDPRLRYFEKINGELIITAPSGIPLIRYNTKDIGDIMYFSEAEKKLKKQGVDLVKVLKKKGVNKLIWKTPIVYLFGRGKFTAVIYGANIYPEHVKLVLEHKTLIQNLTGKFMILAEEKKDHSQKLYLHVELVEKESIEDSKLRNKIRKIFVKEVSKINTEYKNNLSTMKKKVYPKVVLHKYGDPEYFPRGVVKKLA